jgi:uncharacterized membrane protein
MERIEKTIEVEAPLRAVYNQWTQFEEFPRFMAGVKEVKQLDDTHVHWRAELWGKDKEWNAEITEQQPDKRVSWKSVSGPESAGTVRFEPLDADRTEVRLAMAYEPEGAIEKTGDALGVVSSRVQTTLEQFKEFIEQRGRETGGWRGTVHDGQAQAGGGAYQGRVRTSDEERRQRIATAAYYKAERRGFRPGQEVEDWLEAERTLDDSL